MIKYSSYVFVGGASVMLVTRLDMLMIGAMLDLEHLLYYTLANSILVLLSKFLVRQ